MIESTNAGNKTADRIILVGVVFLLVFAPLAFGSVHVWAYTVVQVVMCCLLALFVVDRLLFRSDGNVEWVRTPANLPAVLLLVWVGLQWLPLPSDWVALLSPSVYADKMRAREIFDAAGSVSGNTIWMNLAYYQHPVRLLWLKLLSYGGMFFLVVHMATTRRRILILVGTLISVGVFEAVYGIYQLAADTPRVWWWAHSRFSGQATGTYIVPNHFAGYLVMPFLLSLGALFVAKPKQIRMTSGLGGVRAGVQQAIAWFAPETAGPKGVFLFLAAVTMGVAFLLSGSREGSMALVGALGLGAVVVGFHRRIDRRRWVVIMVGMSVAIWGLHLIIGGQLPQTLRENTPQLRREVVRQILPMIGEYPMIGVGGGNFRYVYPRFMTDPINRVQSSGHAHNDWLEIGCDTGAGGMGLAIAVLAGVWIGIFRVWRNRSDRVAIGIGAGSLGSLLVMGFWGGMDLNMHIPANPLTLAAVAGTGFAAVHCQQKGYRLRFFYKSRRFRLPWPVRAVVAVMMVVALATSLAAAGRHFLAEMISPTEWNSTLKINWHPALSEIESAIAYVPGNADNQQRRALAFTSMQAADSSAHRRINETAIDALCRTLVLNTTMAHAWHDLGYRLTYKTYDPHQYVDRWLPLADRCFDMAVRFAPMTPELLRSAAWYWVWRTHLIPETRKGGISIESAAVQTRVEGIRRFQVLFQQAFRLETDGWSKYAAHVRRYFPDDATIMGIVPPENDRLQREVLKWAVGN